MSNQLTVHLRVYKGKEILRRENGTVANANQIVKLPYLSFEWGNYMRNLTNSGFGIATVEKLHSKDEGKVTEEAKKEIQAEVNSYLKPAVEKELTPEQKENKELRERLAALEEKMNAKHSDGPKEPKEVKVAEVKVPADTEISPEKLDLKNAQKEYKDHFGKKGSPAWTAEQLRAKILETPNPEK